MDKTNEELSWGLAFWSHRSVQAEADFMVEHTLNLKNKSAASLQSGVANLELQIAKKGWLLIARSALNLSGNEIARRVQISRAAYFQMEDRERKGRVTLDTMRRMAAVMNCEFVYVIRPIGESYSTAVWKKLLARVIFRPVRVSHHAGQVGRALARHAQDEELKSSVRKELGWTERISATSTSRTSSSR